MIFFCLPIGAAFFSAREQMMYIRSFDNYPLIYLGIAWSI